MRGQNMDLRDKICPIKNMLILLRMTVCVHGIVYTRRKRDREKKYG